MGYKICKGYVKIPFAKPKRTTHTTHTNGGRTMNKAQFKHAIKMAIEEKRKGIEERIEEDINRAEFFAELSEKMERDNERVILHTMIH